MNSETPAPKGGLREKRSFSLCCRRLITRLMGLSRPCGAKRGAKNILCEQKSVQGSHCKDQRVTRFTIAAIGASNFSEKNPKIDFLASGKGEHIALRNRANALTVQIVVPNRLQATWCHRSRTITSLEINARHPVFLLQCYWFFPPS